MLAGGGASVMVFLGRDAGEGDLARDWVLTHELTHLGFPDLSGAPAWVEEGLATYVEPFARAQAGLITEQAVWQEMVEGLPRGIGASDAGGLDSATGYGRIYWGGALYWMLCDLELRERTANARGLQDVLRAVLAAGGNASVDWSLDRALGELESAARLPVFRKRLQAMGTAPAREDLAALWRRLGVVRRRDGVAFDAGAPLAAMRRSLSASVASAAAR
jgi:predicted metalloprotease with PDZ domain